MSSDVSVTPKERVNITYKAAIGDAEETRELPLRLLLVGDYKQVRDDTPLATREIFAINKQTLDHVMKDMGLSLDLLVPDKLSAKKMKAGDLKLRLKISSLRDLEPDGIVAQVPALKQLAQVRQALLSLKGPLADVPALARGLEGLLDQVKGDEALKARLRTRLEQIIAKQGR